MQFLLLESKVRDKVSDQPGAGTCRHDFLNHSITSDRGVFRRSIDFNLKQAHQRGSRECTHAPSLDADRVRAHLLGSFTLPLSTLLLLPDVLAIASGREEESAEREWKREERCWVCLTALETDSRWPDRDWDWIERRGRTGIHENVCQQWYEFWRGRPTSRCRNLTDDEGVCRQEL